VRILVTGPRDWDDESLVAGALLYRASRTPASERIVIIHGGADGFDTVANRVALHYEWEIERHSAVWYPDGRLDRLAGFKRNQEMVAAGADVCVAGVRPCFREACRKPKPHLTHGTADCIQRALLAGITVVPVKYEGGSGSREPRGNPAGGSPADQYGLPGGSPGTLAFAAAGSNSWYGG